MSKSTTEDNWFKQHEKEMLQQAARQRDKQLKEATERRGREEFDKLRTAHWMKCPKCGHDMETIHLEDIEVENCTFCEGVYFDRVEIESLLLRKTTQRFSLYRKFFGLD